MKRGVGVGAGRDAGKPFATVERLARALIEPTADVQVWKGQLPLGAAAASSPVLFYRHGKVDGTHVQQTRYVRARMGRRVRAYFWGRIAADGALELGDEAPDQLW